MSKKTFIIKNTIWYTVVSLLGRAIAFPKGMIIGLLIVPEQLGLYASIYLWFNYLTMINIGLCSAAGRESAHCFGQKDKFDQGITIQNKAITLDLIMVLVIFVVFTVYSLMRPDFFTITCFLLVGITYLLDRISSYYDRFNSARNLFTGVVKADLTRNIIAPILIIGTIYFIKIYALFIIPVIAILIKITYYRAKMPINYRFTLDFSGMGKYLRVGVFFGISALLSTLYYVVDRTFINWFLDKRVMGLYSFALMFVMMMQALYANFQSILVDVLNKDSANINCENFVNGAMKYNSYISLFTILIVIACQIGYYVVVNCYLLNYRDSASIFIILSPMVYFYAIYSIPNVMLYSNIMRKEKISTLILLIGVVSGVIFNAIFITMGGRGEAVAFGTLLSQVVITGLNWYVFLRYSNRVDMKYITQMIHLTILFAIYSAFFYFITAKHCPLAYCILFALFGGGVFLVITEGFYKLNTFKMAVSLLGNRIRNAEVTMG